MKKLISKSPFITAFDLISRMYKNRERIKDSTRYQIRGLPVVVYISGKEKVKFFNITVEFSI
jgi:hypothetical protein